MLIRIDPGVALVMGVLITQGVQILQAYINHKHDQQARSVNHTETMTAQELTKEAAHLAYAEANQANTKIAALQESSNAATGVPSAPYTNSDSEHS